MANTTKTAATPQINRIQGGFEITWPACPTCGEPSFGGDYCCECSKEVRKNA